MRGFLYHNVVLTKANMIAMGCYEVLLFVAWIVLGILNEKSGENPLSGEGATGFLLIGILIVICSFFFLEFVSQEIFKKCEDFRWYAFAISSPGSVEEYIGGKYKFLLGLDLLVLFLWLLVDSVMGVLCPHFLSLLSVAFLCCCLFLLLQAVESAFNVRFGVNIGGYCKVIFLILLASGLLIYGLFGDISLFREKDLMTALQELLTSDGAIWVMALIPYVALIGFWASYRISVAVYRKGVEVYEE